MLPPTIQRWHPIAPPPPRYTRDLVSLPAGDVVFPSPVVHTPQRGYPSDLTDAQWAHVAPVIPPARRGGNRRHVDEREVVNGLMYILSTGC
jgi:Putative transposase of IS4/5 family (DUF4096)